jgi:hypothetical protein
LEKKSICLMFQKEIKNKKQQQHDQQSQQNNMPRRFGRPL